MTQCLTRFSGAHGVPVSEPAPPLSEWVLKVTECSASFPGCPTRVSSCESAFLTPTPAFGDRTDSVTSAPSTVRRQPLQEHAQLQCLGQQPQQQQQRQPRSSLINSIHQSVDGGRSGSSSTGVHRALFSQASGPRTPPDQYLSALSPIIAPIGALAALPAADKPFPRSSLPASLSSDASAMRYSRHDRPLTPTGSRDSPLGDSAVPTLRLSSPARPQPIMRDVGAAPCVVVQPWPTVVSAPPPPLPTSPPPRRRSPAHDTVNGTTPSPTRAGAAAGRGWLAPTPRCPRPMLCVSDLITPEDVNTEGSGPRTAPQVWSPFYPLPTPSPRRCGRLSDPRAPIAVGSGSGQGWTPQVLTQLSTAAGVEPTPSPLSRYTGQRAGGSDRAPTFVSGRHSLSAGARLSELCRPWSGPSVASVVSPLNASYGPLAPLGRAAGVNPDMHTGSGSFIFTATSPSACETPASPTAFLSEERRWRPGTGAVPRASVRPRPLTTGSGPELEETLLVRGTLAAQRCRTQTHVLGMPFAGTLGGRSVAGTASPERRTPSPMPAFLLTCAADTVSGSNDSCGSMERTPRFSGRSVSISTMSVESRGIMRVVQVGVARRSRRGAIVISLFRLLLLLPAKMLLRAVQLAIRRAHALLL